MRIYNWQQADWPNFHYTLSSVQELLISIMEKTGFIKGQLTHLTENLQTETMINFMIEEAVKTSEIEGEYVNRLDVRSSIINKLGVHHNKIKIRDKRAQGLVDLMFDVRKTFNKPLSKTQLFDWHLMLLGSSLDANLKIGRWRKNTSTMQIVSGHANQLKVHYEAPPSERVPEEMKKFIKWFNETAPGKPDAISYAPVRAAIAHLYFESIHPFEDGNGRIGRAIAEKALSQGFGYPVILSLSQAIEAKKKQYYLALNKASKTNEITEWVNYFVKIIADAQFAVETKINYIFRKTHFFDTFKSLLNERQLKVIERMMEAGTNGFEGGMSAKKYMAITHTSKATATRDLQHLLAMKAITQTGSGRSVRYELNL